MTKFGYHLSSEEHGPADLVAAAVAAEAAGFDFLQISDHFHPWTSTQGHSPFVWTILGAIAGATDAVPIGTAVTCPTMRMHPVITAHAVATTAALLEGRFFFGIGTGERLNEHVLGQVWPPPSVRRTMLEEAVEVMRRLWTGDMVTHRGEHYTVENARLYTLPEAAPPVYISAFGDEAAALAAAIGDGLMSTSPERGTVEPYRNAGGEGPAFSMEHVVVAGSPDVALETAKEYWPNSLAPGACTTELSVPEHFEAFEGVFPDDAYRDRFVLGDDAEAHVERLKEHVAAGFDHVAIHQIGPDQEAFFRLYETEVLPALR